jgi:type III restriction enzyme
MATGRSSRLGSTSPTGRLWDLLKTRRDAKRPPPAAHCRLRRRAQPVEPADRSSRRTRARRPAWPPAPRSVFRRSSRRPSTGSSRTRAGRMKTSSLRVPSADVVAAGLVKKHLTARRLRDPMEICINDLQKEIWRCRRTRLRKISGCPSSPKAIYVSTTNAVDGAMPKGRRPPGRFKAPAGAPDPHLAPPRRIAAAWIPAPSPSTAISSSTRSCRHRPSSCCSPAATPTTTSSSQAESSSHIIFNLSLQEGWDDPECCFAYIDKDMGSPDQVTQVVGRVLRQPGAQHYPGEHSQHRTLLHPHRREGRLRGDHRRRSKEDRFAEAPDITLTVRSSSDEDAETVASRPEGALRSECLSRLVRCTASRSTASSRTSLTLANEDIPLRHERDRRAHPECSRSIGTDSESESEEWVEVDHSNQA